MTIDLDTTDVEVYGRHKRGVAFNHQGQRVGRPHVATWADTATVLAADLLAGNEDPRRDAPKLLRRALAALPAPARAGRIRLRADAGYFAGQLARAALFADIEFAIGARRIAPLWRLLDGIGETDWTDAIDMPGAQVAVADYCPNWWPAATRLLIRRVRLDVSTAGRQVSADPRARRRRTLHPDQRALPLDELAELDAVYGYSFVVTNLDVTTPDRATEASSATASTCSARCGSSSLRSFLRAPSPQLLLRTTPWTRPARYRASSCSGFAPPPVSGSASSRTECPSLRASTTACGSSGSSSRLTHSGRASTAAGYFSR